MVDLKNMSKDEVKKRRINANEGRAEVARAKTKPKPGTRFQTNDKFSKLFNPPSVVAWRGRLVRQHDSVAGAWHVDVEEPKGLPQQVINEKFMEVTG